MLIMKNFEKLSRTEMKNVLGGKFPPGCPPGQEMLLCTTSTVSLCGNNKYCTTTTSSNECWPTYDQLPYGCGVAA
jgi:hypothetical protein